MAQALATATDSPADPLEKIAEDLARRALLVRQLHHIRSEQRALQEPARVKQSEEPALDSLAISQLIQFSDKGLRLTPLGHAVRSAVRSAARSTGDFVLQNPAPFIGAGLGASFGALATDDSDRQRTGRSSLLPNMLGGAMVGSVGGYATQKLVRQLRNLARITGSYAPEEWAQDWARNRQHLPQPPTTNLPVKESGVLSNLLSKYVAPAAGTVVSRVSDAGDRVGQGLSAAGDFVRENPAPFIGLGVGALAGGATGLTARLRRKDRRSLLPHILTGALAGGTAGLGLQLGSRAVRNLSDIASSPSPEALTLDDYREMARDYSESFQPYTWDYPAGLRQGDMTNWARAGIGATAGLDAAGGLYRFLARPYPRLELGGNAARRIGLAARSTLEGAGDATREAGKLLGRMTGPELQQIVRQLRRRTVTPAQLLSSIQQHLPRHVAPRVGLPSLENLTSRIAETPGPRARGPRVRVSDLPPQPRSWWRRLTGQAPRTSRTVSVDQLQHHLTPRGVTALPGPRSWLDWARGRAAPPPTPATVDPASLREAVRRVTAESEVQLPGAAGRGGRPGRPTRLTPEVAADLSRRGRRLGRLGWLTRGRRFLTYPGLMAASFIPDVLADWAGKGLAEERLESLLRNNPGISREGLEQLLNREVHGDIYRRLMPNITDEQITQRWEAAGRPGR